MSEDSRTSAGQSRPCCFRDQRSGKRLWMTSRLQHRYTDSHRVWAETGLIQLLSWCPAFIPHQTERSRPSLRSQGRPSLWRPWTGRRCPSNSRSESRACGCAVFLLLTGVGAGGGGSEMASWSCGNDSSSLRLFFSCLKITPSLF